MASRSPTSPTSPTPSAPSAAAPSANTRFPTVAEIDWHMAHGRRLRAEAMKAAVVELRDWLRGRRGRRAEPTVPKAATPLGPPLMAIRSSAETLRDNPDLTPAQRARFLGIVIAEERRLERLIAGSFGQAALRGR